LAKGKTPFGSDNPKYKKKLSASIWSIINVCCNPNPLLRPSATYVTQLLLEVISAQATTIEAAPTDFLDLESTNMAKKRVLFIVQARRSDISNQRNDMQASQEDITLLQTAVEKLTDPIASFLLGAAIWHKVVPVSMYEDKTSKEVPSIQDYADSE
jgi:hypothetical protein